MIWLTGASSGIGECLAYKLNKLGAKLILSARSDEQLYRVSAACKNGPSAHVLPLDLQKADSLKNKSREALSIHGHIDILLHVSGIANRGMALETAELMSFTCHERLREDIMQARMHAPTKG